MAYIIESPFPSFNDTDGSPLNNGYVYVGSANLNPVTDPIPVYWDEALTQPAAQPIRTINGYLSRNGSPGRIYTNFVTYSFRVTNNKGVQVFSDLNYRDPSSSAGTTYQQVITAIAGQTVFNLSRTYVPGANNLFVYRNGLRLIAGQDYNETGYSEVTLTAGADNGDEFVFDIGYNYDATAYIDAQNVTYKLPVATSVFTDVEAKLAESVSVKDFGAVGDGTTDDTAAFTAAAATNVQVLIPAGSYILTTNVTGYWSIAAQVSFTGAGTAIVAERGFWPDVASGANMNRIRDRLFLNDGAAFTGNRFGNQNGFVSTSTQGANWAPRDSSLFVAQDNGLIAVTGFASNTNIDVTAGQPTETIGVAGFVINNKSSRAAWGLYSDIQHETGTSSYGLEVAGKNKGSNSIPNPYGLGTGVYGVWLAGGGDSSYGGAPTNPSTAGVVLKKNASTWNVGVVFEDNSITGTDGVTGTGTAISLAKGHQIQWHKPDTSVGLVIRGDQTTGENPSFILGKNNGVDICGASELTIARFTSFASAVNNTVFSNATTGNLVAWRVSGTDANIGIQIRTKGTQAVRFQSQDSGATDEFRVGGVNSTPVNYLWAYGTNSGQSQAIMSSAGADTDVDVRFIPKGAGLVRFGTLVATADVPITGYVTIKDSAGNQRKLAVIA